MKSKWQLLACSLVIFSCSSSKNILSIESAETSVVIDGNLSEWKSSNRSYNTGTKLRYGFSRDEDNLYAYFVAQDEQTQMKILNGGLTLKIDTLGGRKGHVTITYPFLDTEKKPTAPREKMTGGIKSFLKSQATTIKLTGFKHLPVTSGLIPVQNNLGLKAALEWGVDGSMIYELCLPLRSFYSIKSENILGITATVNAGSAPQGGSGSMPPGGGPSGGPPGGMMPDRGGSGPGGGSAPQGMGDFNKASSFRIIIKLF